MNERQILFSAEMVRAILDGRKSQTRQVIKDIARWDAGCLGDKKRIGKPIGEVEFFYYDWRGYTKIKPPYGQPGDRLWVGETWQAEHGGAWWGELETDCPEALNWNLHYRADGEVPNLPGWRPSIFMPRWASRITLEVTGVKVERVQDISEEDARQEGPARTVNFTSWRDAFHLVWNVINARRGYAWESNPWVWVISFAVLEPGRTVGDRAA